MDWKTEDYGMGILCNHVGMWDYFGAPGNPTHRVCCNCGAVQVPIKAKEARPNG